MIIKRVFVAVAAVVGLSALAADPPGFPPGKTFSHKAANVSLSSVLGELEKQTGVKVDSVRAEVDRNLRIECDKTPFWEALDRIAKESDHRISFADGGKKLMLVGGGDIVYRETPSSVDRVFRVSTKRVQAVSDFENDRSYVDLTLTLNWEPGISVFLVDQPGKTAVAKDNADQELRVVNEGGGGRVPAAGNGVDLNLRLVEVPRTVRAIKKLEGKIGVIGAASTIDFAFAKPVAASESRSETKDDVVVRLRTDFKDGNELWTARVEYEYPAGGPALESYESAGWLTGNKVWLAHSDGKAVIDNERNGGYEVVAQGDRKAVVIYRFTDDAIGAKLGKPDDWTLHVRTPSRLLSTEIKFSLENVPLP